MTVENISRFQALRKGNLNRFYTKAHVGELVASLLAEDTVHSVLDLGAGKGSLSGAVAVLCDPTKVVTVDIDPASKYFLSNHFAKNIAHTHYQHDVYDAQLPQSIKFESLFDIAVCNPPFCKIPWNSSFQKIFSEAALFEDTLTRGHTQAELIFLAQNLRLVRPGGKIVMILPDGFATSQRWQSFRETLLSRHRVETVVQLPPHAFQETDARCCIISIVKDGVTENVRLMRLSKSGLLDFPLFIDKRKAIHRMDYEFHVHHMGEEAEYTSFRKLNAHINRGSLSTVAIRAETVPTFHTSDFPCDADSAFCLPGAETTQYSKRLIVARAGDILIPRVDRSLHKKLVLVSDGTAALSDCVYRIRLPNITPDKVFDALRSERGRRLLQAATKGVGARLLGKGDLLDLPLFTDDHASPKYLFKNS